MIFLFVQNITQKVAIWKPILELIQEKNHIFVNGWIVDENFPDLMNWLDIKEFTPVKNHSDVNFAKSLFQEQTTWNYIWKPIQIGWKPELAFEKETPIAPKPVS